MRRMSSGYSTSPKTGSGSSLASDRTSMPVANTSIRPVGSSWFSVPCRALSLHLAVDRDHPFAAQGLGDLEGRAVGVGDDLGQAIMVAQIDEQHAAMIAHAMHPARQARLGTLVRIAQITAGMASVGVHNPSQIGVGNRMSARKSAWEGRIVKLGAVFAWVCGPLAPVFPAGSDGQEPKFTQRPRPPDYVIEK